MVNIVHPYVNSLNYLNEIYNIQRTIFGISVAGLNGGKTQLTYLFDLSGKTDFLVSFFMSFISIMIVHSSFSSVSKYILQVESSEI